MRYSFALLLIFILSFFADAAAQNQIHRWKPLSINEKEKIWFDSSMLDTVKGNIFDIWILEMHKPPLQFEGIKGDIYRSMTLYSVNIEKTRYGIRKIVYYDLANKEIYSHDYIEADYNEAVKFTYPILENSTIDKVVQELFKSRGKS